MSDTDAISFHICAADGEVIINGLTGLKRPITPSTRPSSNFVVHRKMPSFSTWDVAVSNSNSEITAYGDGDQQADPGFFLISRC